MAKFILDYVFKITSITPTAQASTSFLKKVLLVVAPKGGVTPGTITLCSNHSAVAAITNNTEDQQLFAGGLASIYVLAVAGLDDLAGFIEGHETDFNTILISSDFADADVTGDLDLGEFEGVTVVSSADDAFLATQAAIENRSAWHTTVTNKAKNAAYYLGKFLSQSGWRNQQYITATVADDVASLGEAEALFDDKISFVISDSEFGNRVALAAVGGKAFAAPYITKNLKVDMQSAALTFISGNQPAYTKKNATLIEGVLQAVIDQYVENGLIDAGTVSVELENDNFVASSDINIAEPKALWRINGNMQQTL